MYDIQIGIPYSKFPVADAEVFLDIECFEDVKVDADSFFCTLSDKGNVVCLFTFNVKVQGRRDFYEIYNVCTARSARGRGYAAALLKAFQEWVAANDERPAIIWLGVKLDNAPAFKTYLKAGFKMPRLTQKNPAGDLMPFPFISLVWRYPEVAKESTDKVFGEIKRMSRAALSREIPKTSIAFSLNDLASLYSHVYSNDKFELGGPLVMLSDGVCVRDIFKQTRGIPGEFAVNVPPGPIIFHTHPLEAYTYVKAVIGTPSIADCMVSLQEEVSIHFIVALEGVYCLSTSAFTRYFLSELAARGCLEDFEYMAQIYLNTEYARGYKRVLGVDEDTFDELFKEIRAKGKFHLEDHHKRNAFRAQDDILYHLNALTIEKLLTFSVENPAADFNERRVALRRCIYSFTDLEFGQLFEVSFLTWETIKLFSEWNLPPRFEAFFPKE